MIRVILVESVPLFRAGIRTVLERFDGCLILESIDHAEIIGLVVEHHPEVAILDASLTAPDALELTCALHQQNPTMGIVILASSPDEELLFQFVRMGASAYEIRSISPETLVDKVRRVGQGEYLITSEVLVPLHKVDRIPCGDQEGKTKGAAKHPSDVPLSPRQLEILRYIARGNSNKEIAKALTISDQTVKNHITSILKKLSLNDRTAAVMHAFRHDWIMLE
jgi:DNA-binding NarL/FixJ family response regulator